MKNIRRNILLGGVLITAVLAVAPVPTASGAPLESYVPEPYEITIRLNARALLDHPLLDPVRLAHQNQFDEVANNVQLITGVDLRTDIDAILLAGYLDDARKDEGLILLQGRWDADRLVAAIRTNERFEEFRSDGWDVYGFWDNDNQRMVYGAFPAGDALVLGDRKGVEAVVAAGRKSLSDHPDYAPLLRAEDEGALIRAIARRPANIQDGQPGAAAIKSLKAASLVINLEDGIAATLRIDTTDAAMANNLSAIINGALAIGRLAQESKELTWLANQVQLTTDQTSVRVDLRVSQEVIDQFIDANPLLRRLMGRPD